MVIDIEASCKVTILGATGSIGMNSIEVLEKSEKKYQVEVVTANTSVRELASIAKKVKAKHAVIADQSLYNELCNCLSGTDIKISAGLEALNEAALIPSDIVIAAIVGYACLSPVMLAIKRGCRLALANKESLVCAGNLIMKEVANSNTEIIPVDSEHNAIFQIIENNNIKNINKIILTASGGVCKNLNYEQLKHLKPEYVVKHPNWNMGAKISVDSSTMMNKGLEIIEAYYLFPVEKSQIEVVLHYESIIHGMIEYVDGSVIVQMSEPDMCLPISVALNWPNRLNGFIKSLNLSAIKSLNFCEIDNNLFPALSLSREALKIGDNAPTVLNVANEIAVQKFLNGSIAFTDIATIIEEVLHSTNFSRIENLDDVFDTINYTREKSLSVVSNSKYHTPSESLNII